MITRKRYRMDFQKKMAAELSTGQSTLSEVSKRERIFVQTLSKPALSEVECVEG